MSDAVAAPAPTRDSVISLREITADTLRTVCKLATRPGAVELLASVVQAEGGPQPFYESLGFRFTGEYEDGEAVLRLPL